MPSTSRAGIEGLGFEIVERPQPSFLFDWLRADHRGGGPHDRLRAGFAIHQALRNGVWEPDPLILDDQALVVHVTATVWW